MEYTISHKRDLYNPQMGRYLRQSARMNKQMPLEQILAANLTEVMRRTVGLETIEKLAARSGVATLPAKKEYMKRFITLTCAFACVLVGCASSGPIQTSKDTYMLVKTSAGGGFVSGLSVKADLIKEGAAFCAKNGQAFDLIGGQARDAQPGVMPSAEITFRCAAQ